MTKRFELLRSQNGHLARAAFDHETQQRVLLLRELPEREFLGEAGLHAMAVRVQELNDERCAKIVCVDPIAVVAPPENRPTGTLREWAHAAMQCVDVCARLRAEGICVLPSYGGGWAQRRNGVLQPVVLAPAIAPGFGRFGPPREWISGVASWVIEHFPRPGTFDRAGKRLRKKLQKLPVDHDEAVTKFFAALRIHLDGVDTQTVEDAARKSVRGAPWRLDFDRAIERGEAQHARMIQDDRGEHDRAFVSWPLAAAYHHRGCLRWAAGDHDAARSDVDRAIEIDPHARYLTTRALFAEGANELSAASFHNAAMLAVSAVLYHHDEPPDVRQRDECRTALSRAAFRHRNGDTAGAIEDLQFITSRWAQLSEPLGPKVEAFLAYLLSLSVAPDA